MLCLGDPPQVDARLARQVLLLCRGATPKDFRVLPAKIILVRHAESEGNINKPGLHLHPGSPGPTGEALVISDLFLGGQLTQDSGAWACSPCRSTPAGLVGLGPVGHPCTARLAKASIYTAFCTAACGRKQRKAGPCCQEALPRTSALSLCCEAGLHEHVRTCGASASDQEAPCSQPLNPPRPELCVWGCVTHWAASSPVWAVQPCQC